MFTKIDNNSLTHTKWDCKYHIIFVPKYRKNNIWKDKNGYRKNIKKIAK